jgi:peptidoglycan/LPS O-acetylase OafA/YrhL
MNRHFPALRGLAILLVVVNHAITLTLDGVRTHGFPPLPGWERVVLVGLRSLGLVAVPIFLFLSGYFAVYAMRGKPMAAAYRSVRLSLQHMLIPYLLWSIVFYLGIYVLLGEAYTVLEYVKFLLVGYPFNFVPLLVLFYLASPLLIRVAQRWPSVVLIGIGLYQLFLAFVQLPGLLGVTLPAWAVYLTPPGLRLTMALWGIFFPLGLVFSLHEGAAKSLVQRGWIALAVASLGLYLLATLDVLGLIVAPLAGVVLPVAVIPLMVLVRREVIPAATSLEHLGRNAYALYLTNLLLISLVLAGALALAPLLYLVPILLAALAGAVAIALPTMAAAALARSPRPRLRLYVFG